MARRLTDRSGRLRARAIQLFDKQHGDFTADDEAALVHLAQMASAAVERTQLYEERG